MTTATHIGRLLAVVTLAAAPALLALFLIGKNFQTGVDSFCPAYDVDQYFYVREAATFAAAGFNGGYYGGNGETAVLGRFGPHGAAYPVLYGSFAKLLGGWHDFLAPVGNLLLVSLALLLCARALSFPAFSALAVSMLLFPPLVFYMPTAYQDAPQIAIGLGLGIMLARFAAAPTRKGFWAALGWVLLATLSRPTWAALFPAICWCAGKPSRRRAVEALLGGGTLLAAGYALFSCITAPWVHTPGITPGLAALADGPAGVWPLLAANLGHLAHFTDNRYPSVVLLFMLAAVVLTLLAGPADRQARLRNLAVQACNFLAPLGLYVAVYTGSGRHLPRLLAAHGALTLAFAATFCPRPALRTVFVPVLAASLALLPATLDTYALSIRPAYDDFDNYKGRIAAQAALLNPALSLSLDAPSPWLRTLAVSTSALTEDLLAAPPAYGLETYMPDALEKPLRPGFALLSPAQYVIAARATPLTPLVETPSGTLYRNDAAFGLAPRPEPSR